MAVFSFSSSFFAPGIKMGAEDFDFAFGNGSGTFGPTSLVFSDGTSTATFTGIGLETTSFFGFLTDVLAGTLTGLEANDGGAQILSITGWSISAPDFYDFAVANNWKALWALMTSGSDDITGTTGRDKLLGGAGGDVLNGGRGADVVNGGAGKDTVAGGLGHDQLIGGAAADKFLFNVDVSNENSDTVKDFVHGVDKVVLDSSFFEELTVGKLAEGKFVTGTEAADGDDFVIFDPLTGNLYYDKDGNIAKNGPELVASFGMHSVITFEDVLVSS